MNRAGLENLRGVLRRAVEEKHVAGISALVLQGQEEYFCAEGFADLENDVPMRRDAICRLYSMTKPVTAAAAMLLIERGVLDLTDPVSKYLPGFKGQGTIVRQLLSMTSGLVYGDHNSLAGHQTAAVFDEMIRRLRSDAPIGTLEMANRLGRCAPAFEPGTSWCYGSSADVMGAVIEAAAGIRFGEFLRRELFDPLEMNDTGFFVPEEKRPRLAKTYIETKDGLRLFEGDHLAVLNRMDLEPAFESGGAGLVSTLDDYARFARMLMGGGSFGGRQILAPGTVRYFTSAYLDERQQRAMEANWSLPGYSYGNFMRVLREGGRADTLTSSGEYGWDGWLGCYFCNAPAENLTLLVMMQRVDTGVGTLTHLIRNTVFAQSGPHK